MALRGRQKRGSGQSGRRRDLVVSDDWPAMLPMAVSEISLLDSFVSETAMSILKTGRKKGESDV